jgi:hypothetical protein
MANAEEVFKAIQANREQKRIKIEQEQKTSKSLYINQINVYLNEMIKEGVFFRVFKPGDLKYPSVFDEALKEVLVNKEPYYYQYKLEYVEDNVGYQLCIELKMNS